MVGNALGESTHLQPPAPATDLKVFDTPNDGGASITISWKKSADDGGGANNVRAYEIWRSSTPGRYFEKVGEVEAGIESFSDEKVKDGLNYYYIVKATNGISSSSSMEVGPVSSRAQWFNNARLNILIPTIIFSFIILFFIIRARRGVELFIRKIAGLNAVDEAIGRATEMGKPVLFVPGILDMSDVQTIAAMSVLKRIARKTAEYETPLLVLNADPIVYSVAQEMVKDCYTDAGRPDAYNPNNIRFLTHDQFGFAAGVDGIMIREKPAANFFLGWWRAESLILAETGHSIGAIQIAGTAELSQLPFFVAACDYTLIGEEFYAASAYLSREPVLLGSIKGQDWGKAIIMAVLIIGIILESFGLSFLSQWFVIR